MLSLQILKTRTKFWKNRPFLRLFKRPQVWWAFVFFLFVGGLGKGLFAETLESTTDYDNRIRPLLKTYCLECHSTKVQKAGFDIEQFATLDDVRSGLESWQEIVEMLDNEEMPPPGKLQPGTEERRLLSEWIRKFLRHEADLRAGDPGPVAIRRLNNAEYRYTIRDLTGVDLQPTSQFPADGAAGEGFLNATDSLVMSPGLMNKYLDAAKKVASHAVLLPDGFRFSKSEFQEDWVNEVLGEILNLYAGYLTELGEIPFDRYFAATMMHFDELAAGNISVEQVAKREKLSPKYLATLWHLLTDDEASVVVQDIQAEWNTCRDAVSTAIINQATGQSSQQVSMDLSNLLKTISTWQELLWRRQRPDGQLATNVSAALSDRFVTVPISLVESHVYELNMPAEKPPEEGKPAPSVVFYLAVQTLHRDREQVRVVLQNPRFETLDPAVNGDPLTLREALNLTSQEADDPAPPEGVLRLVTERLENAPEDQSPQEDRLVLHDSEILEVRLPAAVVAGRKFVVKAMLAPPDVDNTLVRFEVRRTPAPVQFERTLKWQGFEQLENLPLLVADGDEKVHNEMQSSFDELCGVFPVSLCYSGIIVRDATVTLERFHRGDRLLSELLLSENHHEQLDKLWQQLHYISQDAKQVRDSFATLIQGEMHFYKSIFQEIQRRADETDQMWLDSEPHHIDALLDFARRAYRRPLTSREQQALRDLYQSLRREELPQKQAVRILLSRVLVSPNFLFRIEQPLQGEKATPVNDYELATRLSYFLWSTTPDEELLQVAADGKLCEPVVLARQTQRMLQDSKTRALAIEFGTQWLEVRGFDQFQGKDQQRFPTFDAPLRQAMYEESILFFQDLFQADRSVWDLIDADHTFLNEPLATFYGVPDIKGSQFRRVENVKTFGRGGMLGWASVLAKHSGASRTSPVLRGNWIAETVLGQRLPRPPPEVPKLPENETAGELTIRQLVEKHTELQQCAVCHQRIDPLGFALEQYDTIGRRREKDLGGRPVDVKSTLKDGTEFEGISGLRKYLLTQRRDEFTQQFCRKLLGYALGRGVILSDRKLLEEMTTALEEHDGRLSAAIVLVVKSKQFQYMRGSTFVE